MTIDGPRPVPWGGNIARLRASERVRKVIPTGLALTFSDLVYGALYARNPARRAAAEAAMEAIVGGTPAEPDIPRLARRHALAEARQWEMAFRPWELRSSPIDGIDNLRKARVSGRGIIISITHFGPLLGWVALARHLDETFHVPTGEWFFEPPPAGYNGYQVEQRRKVLIESGFALLRARGSARPLRQLLKDGEMVILNIDLPGSTPTPFLGKTVEMTNNTARLATFSDSLVVPAALVPEGRRWRIRIEEALDPRDHPTPDDLHFAVMDVHTRAVMRAPEHLEDPLRLGGWAQATRAGWRVTV